jgi:hypothetical protein
MRRAPALAVALPLALVHATIPGAGAEQISLDAKTLSVAQLRQDFERYGSEGLAGSPASAHAEPEPPELEARILEMTEQFPTYSYIRNQSAAAFGGGRGVAASGTGRVAAARTDASLPAASVA